MHHTLQTTKGQYLIFFAQAWVTFSLYMHNEIARTQHYSKISGT